MEFSRREWLCFATGASAALNGHALFNGKDLAGWSRSANGIWMVERGEIVGRCDRDKPGFKSPRGAIGLQIHGGKPHDHVVRFRNLVLI